LDIKVNKQKKSILTRFWPVLVIALVITIAIKYSAFLAQVDGTINGNTLIYGEVQRGQFSASVRGTGLLVPDKIQWLAASVDGHVERVVVKPGKFVTKGELIVELSNPQLKQLRDETKWELEAQMAESKASQVEQKTRILVQESVMLDAQLNYESSKLKLDAHTELIEKNTGAVSQIDFEETQLETKQFKQRWHIQDNIHQAMKNNMVAQNNARQSRLNKIRKTLERADQQVENLMIYASLDSVVQEVSVEPGQRIVMGNSLAKLAQKDSLIAELQVPELMIGEVNIGQSVIIDTRNNIVMGTVSRVDPAVINGNVQVDVVFDAPLPSDARPDLSVDGEIQITDITDTLYVNRPIFAQSQSKSSLYKLTADGFFAERVNIMLGKGSMNKIQIIEGLDIGDKIIISDPSDFQQYQKIRIN
jgi:multidrug resistance efflux pump